MLSPHNYKKPTSGIGENGFEVSGRLSRGLELLFLKLNPKHIQSSALARNLLKGRAINWALLSSFPSLSPFRVMEHSDANRMTTQNIGIVFGPTLLRPERDVASLVEGMVYQNQVVELLLIQFHDIFGRSGAK